MTHTLPQSDSLTPREIVARLDENIIGQHDAKRAVAIALRNRYRWNQLPETIRREVTPKNIIMIGPTGVGKTEITRRLASLMGAPFIKVEATKYTEVGYYGRDVESMVRDLVEASANLLRTRKRDQFKSQAEATVEERLLDLLLPDIHTKKTDFGFPSSEGDGSGDDNPEQKHSRNREKFREMLREGKLEDRKVELSVKQKAPNVQVLSNMGMENMENELQGMFEKIMPRGSKRREIKIAQARDILLEEEIEHLLDKDSLYEEAIRLAEDSGIIFIDEIDKICASDEGTKSADVSRQGVQRDLLPIVEGTTVQSKHGPIRTENILFIAAGAFHRARPSDLMPELQGRFPIRVELNALTREDFRRILTEPSMSLTRQYQELLRVDGVEIDFTHDGLELIADLAFDFNQSSQNIGARRLHTVLERLLEDISFEAPESEQKQVTVDGHYVNEKLKPLMAKDDLSKFIL